MSDSLFIDLMPHKPNTRQKLVELVIHGNLNQFNQSEVAILMGISPQRVSVVEEKALGKLRDVVRAEGTEDIFLQWMAQTTQERS